MRPECIQCDSPLRREQACSISATGDRMVATGKPDIAGHRPKWATLAEMCRDRAASEPDRRNFVFLENGTTQCASLTLSELDRRAATIAPHMHWPAPQDTRVLLTSAPATAFIPD